MSTLTSVHRILLVDDNPSIHEDIRKILISTEGDSLAAAEADLFGDPTAAEETPSPDIRFELHSALQGQQALAMVEESVRNEQRFSMAFVDVRMPPGWNGIETIQRLWQVESNLEVVICTAYSDYSWREIVAQLGYTDRFLILKKPFEGVEVRQLAMTLSAKAALRQSQANQLAILELAVEERSAELRAARDFAEQGSRAKSEFLANMSHEIRTPLNGIVGMLELLEHTDNSESQKRYIRGAQTSVDCLLSLINDVLDFSKIEAGKIELDPIPFDLRKLLEDVAEMMSPKGQSKGLEICCDLANDLPTWVNGDADRLRQVVLNLASNAVKFTEKGQVVIRARRCDSKKGTPTIRFEVADTGIGIPEEGRGRLFKLFSQVDASTTRRFGGTGLGLALCKRLVELFGGEIGVDSISGKGSTFWFTANLDPVARQVESEVVPGNLQGLRVLVVDDNATNLEIASGHLQRWGIPCEVSDHAPKALDELKNAHRDGRPYGLAILDMQMPDMDGRELVELIRSTPEIADMPLIMLTSIGKEVSGEQSIAGMLSEYLAKPIRQSRLFDAVMSATSREQVKIPELPIAAAKSALSKFEGKGYHALVAEDNEVNQVVIRELITRIGLACTLAGNGQLAVELAASKAFDLVLMDCQMPVMDGIAATQAIREGEATSRGWSRRGARLPVIALTANAIAGDREQCLAAGMDDYLTKPIDRKALVSLLEKWLTESTPAPTVEPLVVSDSAPLPAVNATDSNDIGVRDCFDPADLLERCFGDCEMAVELLNMFEHCAQTNLGAIDQAAARQDRVGLVRIAHTLKGVAGNLSATNLLELTATFDRDYRRADFDCESLLRDVSTLRREVERCLVAVPELRRSIQDQVSPHSTR